MPTVSGRGVVGQGPGAGFVAGAASRCRYVAGDTDPLSMTEASCGTISPGGASTFVDEGSTQQLAVVGVEVDSGVGVR